MDFNFPLDISALISFRCEDVPGVTHCDTEKWLCERICVCRGTVVGFVLMQHFCSLRLYDTNP